MPIYELTPTDHRAALWSNSNYTGPCRVHADTERDARWLAAEAFHQGTVVRPNDAIAGSPWMYDHLVGISLVTTSGNYMAGRIEVPGVSDGVMAGPIMASPTEIRWLNARVVRPGSSPIPSTPLSSLTLNSTPFNTRPPHPASNPYLNGTLDPKDAPPTILSGLGGGELEADDPTLRVIKAYDADNGGAGVMLTDGEGEPARWGSAVWDKSTWGDTTHPRTIAEGNFGFAEALVAPPKGKRAAAIARRFAANRVQFKTQSYGMLALLDEVLAPPESNLRPILFDTQDAATDAALRKLLTQIRDELRTLNDALAEPQMEAGKISHSAEYLGHFTKGFFEMAGKATFVGVGISFLCGLVALLHAYAIVDAVQAQEMYENIKKLRGQ